MSSNRTELEAKRWETYKFRAPGDEEKPAMGRVARGKSGSTTE